MSCGCQTYTCPKPVIPGIPPIITTLNDRCCSPLTRDKLLFDVGLTGDDRTKVIAVSHCGVDIRAPNLPDGDCIVFSKVLNPCEEPIETVPLYICCGCCELVLDCFDQTVYLPGSCDECICTYYQVTYDGDVTTKVYMSPPTTESANNQKACECEDE